MTKVKSIKMESFRNDFNQIINDHKALNECDNDCRRKLFSRAELLRMRIEEFSSTSNEERKSVDTEILTELDEFIKKIPLLPAKRKTAWWSLIDFSFRFTGFAAAFVFVGIFASIPVVALKYVDKLLDLDVNQSFSIRLRKAISWYLLYVCGVSQTVIGADTVASQLDGCAILTFAHASNLDGFMVSSTCPIPHYALAKKELFVVPFFSWYSLAVGGIPVDRNNRERAINALQRSTEAVKDGRMCIVVAPEGTRSNSGHLNSFKKG